MREFSVRPWAAVCADPNDPRFDDLLDALEADTRVLGLGGLSTTALGPVGTIFQVETETLADAAGLAVDLFDAALDRAGFPERTAGVSAVVGGDPEGLP
jgi:hypothetical protein